MTLTLPSGVDGRYNRRDGVLPNVDLRAWITSLALATPSEPEHLARASEPDPHIVCLPALDALGREPGVDGALEPQQRGVAEPTQQLGHRPGGTSGARERSGECLFMQLGQEASSP